MVKAQDVFRLLPPQVKSFLEFKAVGEQNKGILITEAAEFICKQVNYNPETGDCNKVVVGVSGGVDSAVVLALAVKAVGADNVIAVKMPDRKVSSKESIEYADLLVERFKVKNVYEIAIEEAVNAVVKSLAEAGIGVSDSDIGNIRARLRMVELYAIASKMNGRVAGTCNRTEIEMGYLTKFGDGADDFNAIGKIWKTWIWIIAEELSVPEKIIRSKPTADLIKGGQTDEKDMGINYSALDLMLYKMSRGTCKTSLWEIYHYPRRVVEMVLATKAKNAHKSKRIPVKKYDIWL